MDSVFEWGLFAKKELPDRGNSHTYTHGLNAFIPIDPSKRAFYEIEQSISDPLLCFFSHSTLATPVKVCESALSRSVSKGGRHIQTNTRHSLISQGLQPFIWSQKQRTHTESNRTQKRSATENKSVNYARNKKNISRMAARRIECMLLQTDTQHLS